MATITNLATANQTESNEVIANILLALIVTKYQNGTCDEIDVSSGDIITYKIVIENPNDSMLYDVEFVDLLDDGVEYVDGSFKVDFGTKVPTINGQEISYTIPTLNAYSSTTIEFEVEVL